MRERRVLLDRQAQLDEDLAGQGDPGDLVAQGDDLDLDLDRLALAGLDVEDLERLDQLQERGRLALLAPGARSRRCDVSTSSGVIFGRGSLTRADFTRSAPGDLGLEPRPGPQHLGREDHAHPGGVLVAALAARPSSRRCG